MPTSLYTGQVSSDARGPDLHLAAELGKCQSQFGWHKHGLQKVLKIGKRVLLRNTIWFQHTPSFWNRCTRSFRYLFYQQLRVLVLVPCSWMYLGNLFFPVCITWNIQGCVYTSIIFSRFCLSFYFSYKKCTLKAGAFWQQPPYLLCHFSMTRLYDCDFHLDFLNHSDDT